MPGTQGHYQLASAIALKGLTLRVILSEAQLRNARFIIIITVVN